MSRRPLSACILLAVFLFFLVLCTAPVSGMTVHLPDHGAVPSLLSGMQSVGTSHEFRYDRVSGTWSAIPPEGRTGIVVSGDGTVIFTAPAGSFAMQYGGIGRNGAFSSAGAGTIRAERNRLTIDRGTAQEWYVSGNPAIEQGMTIAERPDGSGPLAVNYMLAGNLQPRLTGETLVFFDPAGPVLQYGGLSAHDADGRTLPARLDLSGTTLSWQVDDKNAVYPVTIDPVISGTTTLLNATQPRNPAYFGYSVSRYNDTILIGAYDETVGTTADSGQAYFFTQSGGTWSQTASFNKSEATTDVNFGYSVSLWNDTALVGVPNAYASGVANSGQVYVFTRSGDTWIQTQILSASDAASNSYGHFGYSVSLWNDTALIGANSYAVSVFGDAGKAYIFSRSGGTWTQSTSLNATDTSNAAFGESVSLFNDTALIGAIEADGNGISTAGQAYVFKKSGGTWNQTALLNASDAQTYAKFGRSVGFYNDTFVVGAEQHDFGGKSNAGQAYVFSHNNGVWTRTAILNASDAAASAQFGISVSVFNDTVLVGANQATVDGTSNAGKAYLFNSSTGWSQTGALTASDSASQTTARFGTSVFLINATTALIGAKDATVNSVANAGQAYLITFAEVSVPSASFTSANVSVATNSTTQGWAGLRLFTMQFTDTSTNSPTSWKWARQNLTHTTWTVFNTSQNARDSFWTGNWSVNLTATNGAGSSVSAQTLWVNVSQDALTVTGITPATGQNTTTISITNLAGTGFYDSPWVNLTKSGQTNITATSVTVVSSNKITCTFDLANKIAGTWNVNVTNPDGEVSALLDGFTITNSSTPTPTPTSTPAPAPTSSGGDSPANIQKQAAASGTGVSTASGAAAGQTVTYSFGEQSQNSPVVIESITFVPDQTVGQSQCLVSQVTPAEAFSIPDRPAVYESIQVNWINPGVMTDINIQFSVKGSWIREQNVDPKDIVMMRQHDLAWAEIPTVFDHVANDIYYYRSTTPGFSNFAVSVRKNATTAAVSGAAPVPEFSPAAAGTVAPDTVAGSTPSVIPVRPTATTPATVPAPVGEPGTGMPLLLYLAAGAGIAILAAVGFFIGRRWWWARQNPGLFRKN